MISMVGEFVFTVQLSIWQIHKSAYLVITFFALRNIDLK